MATSLRKPCFLFLLHKYNVCMVHYGNMTDIAANCMDSLLHRY
jgi:hypothetical protein